MPTADPFAIAADLFDPRPDPYLHDPAGWVKDKLGEHLWSRQIGIIESVRDNRRTAVPSAHGMGKSFSASRLVAWWLDVHPPGSAFAVTTAPTDKQVKAILWREIKKAWKKGTLGGRVLENAEWKIGEELVAYGRKPADTDEDGFQGIHARYVLVILDEACGIPKQLWTAANTLLTNDDARMLAIGNPDDPDSEFAKVCEGADPNDGGRSVRGWNVLPISVFHSPNFTDEKIPADLAPMLTGQTWVDEFLADVGSETSPLYVSKVTGRFPADAADGTVPWSWIKKCQDVDWAATFAPLQEPVELGVDVGGSDTGDETVVYERRGPHAGHRWAVRSSDPDIVLQLVEQALREARPDTVKLDSIGIGWGLLAPLRRDFPEIRFVGVNVAEAASTPTKFANLRAQLWWEVGRLLSKDRGWDLTAVDHDSTLAELAAPRWREDKSGRIVIESKDDIRKRIGRSTDNADALLLAFYRPPAVDVGVSHRAPRRALRGSR